MVIFIDYKLHKVVIVMTYIFILYNLYSYINRNQLVSLMLYIKSL